MSASPCSARKLAAWFDLDPDRRHLRKPRRRVSARHCESTLRVRKRSAARILNRAASNRPVLDTLDTAIHETEAIIAKLKAVKQGLLHDLLTRGIDANGELRPPQAEAPHLYKQSPLGWIPKEWETSSVVGRYTLHPRSHSAQIVGQADFKNW